MNKRKCENLVRAALVGWARNSDFPSMAVFLILSLCLAAGCQRKTIRDEKPTDQKNQSRQSNQDTQRALDKGDLKLLNQPRHARFPGLEVPLQVILRSLTRLSPTSTKTLPCPGMSLSHFRIAINLTRTTIRKRARSRFVTSLSMSITTYSLTKSKIRRSLTTRFAGLWPRPSFMNWDTDWWMLGSCL